MRRLLNSLRNKEEHTPTRKKLKIESLRQKDNLIAAKKKNMINFSGIDIKVTTEFSNRNYKGQNTVKQHPYHFKRK